MDPRDVVVTSGRFAAHTPAERLMVALAELSVTQGFVNTTPAQICERAGVDRSAFDDLFATTEDCLLAAYDRAVDQAFNAALRAFMSTPSPWANATHAALAAFLTFIAETPAFAHLCVIESHHCADRAFAHRERAMRRFLPLLQPGYQEPAAAEPSPITSELIVGGVFDVIHRHTFEQRLQRLPEALPTVTVLALTPFVGRDEAVRVATS